MTYPKGYSANSFGLSIQSFGAVGDGITDATVAIQTAINEVFAAGGGTVWVPAGDYICNNVLLKSNVFLRGETDGMHQSVRCRLKASTAGVILDTESAQVVSAGVSGLALLGLGAGTAVKGIRIQNGLRVNLKNLFFNSFSDQAVQLCSSGTGLACTVQDIFAQNCLLNRTRAQKDGVLEILGTDHWIRGGEYTASLSGTANRSSANLYCTAVLVGGANCFLQDVVAEISDVGFHVTGATNRLIGCRADLNQGDGFDIRATNYGLSCIALNNSQHASNTYDGWIVTVGNGQYTNCTGTSNVANIHRYGLNDTQASDATKNHYVNFRSTGAGTGQILIAASGASVVVPTGPSKAFTSLDTTPSVGNYGTFRTVNAGATSITTFDDGFNGQEFQLLCTDANTTLVNGATLKTTTGANKTLVANRVYSFLLNGSVWYEVGP